ncbi:MAG: SDR family oxidoreductase [Gemmataceae bacterium]
MGQRRRLTGARMLITGASQGIGKQLALAAAQRGAKVLAAARNEELLHELVAEGQARGLTIEYVVADVTSADDRRKMVEAAQSEFGGLDILVNNAGIGATGHFADVGAERMRKIFEVNLFGTTETTRVFLPILKQAAKEGKRPAIVNISSIAGKRGIPARSEYSASKFAVQGFSEAIRAELAKDGVDVLVVCPGLTQTNFSKNMLEQKALVPLDHMRGMTAEQVAWKTVRCIEKGKNEVVLTFKAKLIAWVSKWFPRFADMVVRKKIRGLFKEERAARQKRRADEAAGQKVSV